MLIRLNKNQHYISSTILLMVLGSWLLLFCQNCLAAIVEADNMVIPVQEKPNPCHSSESSGNVKVADSDDSHSHCLGVCDCNDLDASLNNAKFDSGQAEKIKNTIDTCQILTELITKDVELKTTYKIATLPERATIIPLQHFTVLLN